MSQTELIKLVIVSLIILVGYGAWLWHQDQKPGVPGLLASAVFLAATIGMASYAYKEPHRVRVDEECFDQYDGRRTACRTLDVPRYEDAGGLFPAAAAGVFAGAMSGGGAWVALRMAVERRQQAALKRRTPSPTND